MSEKKVVMYITEFSLNLYLIWHIEFDIGYSLQLYLYLVICCAHLFKLFLTEVSVWMYHACR